MNGVDPDVLRAERDNASVLKAKLATLREGHRCRMVIVLEGKDDLPVFEAWIKRLDDAFEWEPMLAKGKRKALEFRRLIQRDLTGLGVCTYFIVDHDYDGMRSHTHGDDVFLLPAYSVENYLVHESVLDSYLRTELRIIGTPDVRQALVDRYVQVRDNFMALVRGQCEVLYGARNEPVGNVVVGDVKSTVGLSDEQVTVQTGVWLEDLVETENPVSERGMADAQAFFERRDLSLWIRGKFLLDFFKDFCELLYRDLTHDQPVLFDGKATDTSLSPAGVDLRSLAAKSPMPEGLGDALSRWQEDCRTNCVA